MVVARTLASFVRWLWRVLMVACRRCGSLDVIHGDTPDHERPHWRIYCVGCGERRDDLDSYSERPSL